MLLIINGFIFRNIQFLINENIIETVISYGCGQDNYFASKFVSIFANSPSEWSEINFFHAEVILRKQR